MGLVRCKIKCKHMLRADKSRREKVQITAQEDMKHVLLYVGYVARDTELLREFVIEN
jgi:hypothetical protein